MIETVREKFSCRDCETISQAPAPFHVIPRAWAGPSLLAMIVFEKFGQHQPLNRKPTAMRSRARRSRFHHGRRGGRGLHGARSAPAPEGPCHAAERLHGDDSVLRGSTQKG